jgi:AraC-like DNA-binding protein
MESIEDFYKRLSYPMPKELDNGIGHFNVFTRTPNCINVPYSRKNYFKITLLKGPNIIHYADKTLETKEYALMFSDPLVPYSWESLNGKKEGYFCIFTESFFYEYKNIREYPVFDPTQNKLFLLDSKANEEVENIFQKMLQEIQSDYTYKYDLLRNFAQELIHMALKMSPAPLAKDMQPNKKNKISTLFNELLNRQFPINLPYERLELKSPSDYARLLDIHTNHLNKTLKELTGNTTTQLISQRILEEAKILLKHSNWSVSDISYSLGYEESAHFINFFKKNIHQTPQTYRSSQNV